MNKKIAIMQPYFMPYIGYFQLINSVDEFILYDNIQFTKKGWINRNRILLNEKEYLITIPLKKDSDYLNVLERELSEQWIIEKKKMSALIENAYRKAPFFKQVIGIINDCLNCNEKNLFKFIYNSIISINNYLDIKTPISISSSINVDHSLKSKDKVVSLCKAKNARVYLNPIGGINLYEKKFFLNHDLELYFLKTKPFEYKQFSNDFVPWLSIIDVMMFNSQELIRNFLNECIIL